MQDSATARRIRDLSAALAITAEPMPFERVLSRGAVKGAADDVKREREAIRRLIPDLRSAQANGDLATWDRVADRAGTHWRAIRAAYIGSARRPEGREIIARLLDQAVGGGGAGHH
jgi:hypothetical protein